MVFKAILHSEAKEFLHYHNHTPPKSPIFCVVKKKLGSPCSSRITKSRKLPTKGAEMTMPNFLIIGAPKSGTTSIYQYLAEHPEVFMSPVKEPHFFAFEGQTLSFRGPGDDREFGRYVTTIEEYQNLFQNVSDEKAIGEATPSYLSIQSAPGCIQKYVPGVKMIAILRNPVDRAFSNFVFMVQLGYEPLTEFQSALEQEESRISAGWSHRFHYKRRGFYY